MKKRFLLSGGSGLIIVFLLGCATRTLTLYEQCVHKYDRNHFLVGNGEANLREDNPKSTAEDRARADLAKQIKVRVKEMSLTKVIEKNEVVSSYAEILTQTIAESELKGTRIVYSKPDKDRGVYRAICILSRKEASKWLSEEIDAAYKLTNDYFSLGKKEESRARLKPALIYLRDALTSFFKGKAFEQEYNVIIAPMRAFVSFKPQVAPPPQDSIEILLNSILNSIRLRKVRGDGQHVVLGEGARIPFEVQVFYKSKGVPDIPLIFKFKKGKGELKSRAVTNDAGIAKCVVYKVETPLKPNIISCRIAGKELEQEVWEKEKVEFSLYGISKREVTRIIVAILEENFGKSSSLRFSQPKLISQLSDSGFTVVQKELPEKVIDECLNGKLESVKELDVDILIVGKVSSFSPSEIEGYFFIAHSQAVVEIVDFKKKVIIASCELTDKDGGITAEKAGIAALKKISSPLAGCVIEKLKELKF